MQTSLDTYEKHRDKSLPLMQYALDTKSNEIQHVDNVPNGKNCGCDYFKTIFSNDLYFGTYGRK